MQTTTKWNTINTIKQSNANENENKMTTYKTKYNKAKQRIGKQYKKTDTT